MHNCVNLVAGLILLAALILSGCGGQPSFQPPPPPPPSPTVELSVSESGSGTVTSSPGGIICGSTCIGSFDAGTSVTLTAVPASGSSFAGWSGACSGSSGTCTVVLNQPTTVAAGFHVIPLLLTVSETTAGAGVVTSNPAGINCGQTCSAGFDPGTTVALTAIANSGFVFNGWSGACSGTESCTIPLTAAASVTANFKPVPQPPHVVLVVEENSSFSTVYPNGMPWLSSLGDSYGIATNYSSDEAGSLHAYLWLSSGSGEDAFGCDGSRCSQLISGGNIFRALNKAGLSWKVYADSLPSVGFMGDSSGYYVKHHNAAPWYSDVANDSEQRQNIVPFTHFAADLATHALPNYSVIIPNQEHDDDMGTLAMADQWLRDKVSPLLSSSYFSPGGNGVMFITFDNADGDAQGLVFTAVVGVSVRPGIKVSTAFRHENTLRTMMELLGLSDFPGASATAAPMREFFK